MDTVKLFTYGTLMRPKSMERFVGSKNIIDVVPAIINGKMYTMESETYPVVIRPNEGRRARAPLVVFGALYTLNMSHDSWVKLDCYEGCSKAVAGLNLPQDLYHRHKIKAKEISFNNMIDFMDFKFQTGEEHECFIYLGNMKNTFIRDICTRDRRKNGIVWRDFFDIF